MNLPRSRSRAGTLQGSPSSSGRNVPPYRFKRFATPLALVQCSGALFEPPRVHPAQRSVERDLAALLQNRFVAAEQLAQAQDSDAERLPCGVRFLVAPERIAQRLFRDVPAAVGDERLEQRERLLRDLARELQGLVVDEELEAAQRADANRPRPQVGRVGGRLQAEHADDLLHELDFDAFLQGQGEQWRHGAFEVAQVVLPLPSLRQHQRFPQPYQSARARFPSPGEPGLDEHQCRAQAIEDRRRSINARGCGQSAAPFRSDPREQDLRIDQPEQHLLVLGAASSSIAASDQLCESAASSRRPRKCARRA